jgi:hypothetical protein
MIHRITSEGLRYYSDIKKELSIEDICSVVDAYDIPVSEMIEWLQTIDSMYEAEYPTDRCVYFLR